MKGNLDCAYIELPSGRRTDHNNIYLPTNGLRPPKSLTRDKVYDDRLLKT